MTRRQQDFYTWLVAVGVLASQVVLAVMEKETVPALIAGAFGLLGLPTIRKVQDAVNSTPTEPEAKL
jgi:hypothetical protein